MNQLYEMFRELDKGILHYNYCEIRVLIDKDGNSWFHGRDVADSLGYEQSRHAVQKLVDIDDRVMLSKINYDKVKYKQIKDDIKVHHNAAYLTEGGLYQLILSSRLKTAKEFKKWITNDVIPSIRKYGYYAEKKRCGTKIRNLKDKVKYYQNERKKIKNDCTKCEYPSGGMVYAIDVSTKYEKLYRMGTTKNMKNRKQIYNTHTLHNYTVAHYIETSNHFSVESCIKCILRDYQYIYDENTKKDIYKCSLDAIKKAFNVCVYGVKQTGGSKTSARKNTRANFYDNIVTKRIKGCNDKIITLKDKATKMDMCILSKKRFPSI